MSAGYADRVRSSSEAMREAVAHRAGDPWLLPLSEHVERLAEVARVDLCLARLVEGHADAVRILHEAGAAPSEGVYAVWASRSLGTGLRAEQVDGGWRLSGEVRFASGIDLVDRALVPGWVDEQTHLLFDVPATLFDADRSTWHTSAMDASRSFTVCIDAAVDTDPVGPAGFYLDRPGFVLGGLGVAAVWAGGAQAVRDLVAAGLRDFGGSPHQLRRVGAIEQAVWQARTVVQHTAASVVPGDPATTEAVTAARTSVVEACDRVLAEAGLIVGPAGLSRNGRLARTLADLSIYIRQHHLDVTLEAAGRRALERAEVTG